MHSPPCGGAAAKQRHTRSLAPKSRSWPFRTFQYIKGALKSIPKITDIKIVSLADPPAEFIEIISI